MSISRFVRYRVGAQGAPSWGLLDGDTIRQLSAAPYLDHQQTGHSTPRASATLLAPGEPPKVFAIGRNYKSHLGTRPQPTQPEVFYKPITCLQDPGGPIVLPANSENVHYEGELVLVMGRRLSKASQEEAAAAIFGVTCGNDVSDRFWQNGGEGGAGKDLQWWRAKGADTFGPLGPVLVRGLEFGNLMLTTRLNGEVVQQQTTADLLFDSVTIVSYISQNVTIQPGDLIYTGTPGSTKKLKPGDTVEVEIAGIGVLSNPVIAGACSMPVYFFKPFALTAARVALILVGAFGINFLFHRALERVWLYIVQGLQRSSRGPDPELEKQANTIAGVLRRTTTVLIYALAFTMALRELGFDIAPLIAGAGVAGLAIGFGAQNLVRDVISGFFLLIENQIRVNDSVVINDTPGMVEEINLRTTVLRDGEGTVHVFPNGAITKLANRTQGFSYYMFNLHLSYKDDPDAAIGIMQETAAQLATEEPYAGFLLGALEVFGVDQLGETHVVVKGRIKTLPGKQWDIGREMNRRMKQRLEAAGFDLPARGLRRVEIVLPPGAAVSSDALRTAVREIVEEMQTHDDDLGAQRKA